MLDDLPVNIPRWITTAMRPRSVGASLEERQSSNSSCPSDNYKASTNMTFDTHCNSLPTPSSDSIANPSANSLEDCLNQCSMNPDVLCAAALYEVNSTTCYFFGNGTSFSDSHSNQNYQWGTAIDADVQPIPETCNGPSGLQSQTASNGMTFQIFCNTDNGGHDLCPDTDPSCRWHADSLEECLNHCSTNHPLCAGVARL